MSTTTACRLNETVDLLAARSPELGSALAKAVKAGLPYLVLDGTQRVGLGDQPGSGGQIQLSRHP
ncbi:MAG TPA: hypothetical protein VFV01_42000 [Spirillospora sp.]|nr:hypothetical protein [Spirillospora sp.]